nr:uncharacterized protein LOC108350036 isoform X7 [Rattus norvegicus]XP_038959653.1 uncharacterized protein LOC108350036 isoform X7 [Rattus norvegicus]
MFRSFSDQATSSQETCPSVTSYCSGPREPQIHSVLPSNRTCPSRSGSGVSSLDPLKSGCFPDRWDAHCLQRKEYLRKTNGKHGYKKTGKIARPFKCQKSQIDGRRDER